MNYKYGNYEMLGISVFWFVITLFWTKLVYRIVLCKIEKNRFIFILFGAFISMIISEKIWLPQNLDVVFVAMLFMECGFCFKEYGNKLNAKKILGIVGILSFGIWIHFSWANEYFLSMASRTYKGGLFSVFLAIIGCLCVVLFCESIENTKLSKVLAFVGKYSYELLCIHWIESVYINYVNHQNLLVGSLRVVIDCVILVLWITIKEKILTVKNKKTI